MKVAHAFGIVLGVISSRSAGTASASPAAPVPKIAATPFKERAVVSVGGPFLIDGVAKRLPRYDLTIVTSHMASRIRRSPVRH